MFFSFFHSFNIYILFLFYFMRGCYTDWIKSYTRRDNGHYGHFTYFVKYTCIHLTAFLRQFLKNNFYFFYYFLSQHLVLVYMITVLVIRTLYIGTRLRTLDPLHSIRSTFGQLMLLVYSFQI